MRELSAQPHDLCIQAYRRITRNAKKGTGTRLSADETWAIAVWDGAIQAAVMADDLDRADEEAGGGDHGQD